MIQPPAKSTVHAVLDRHGLVKRRKRRRYKAQGTALQHVKPPNQPGSPKSLKTRSKTAKANALWVDERPSQASRYREL